MSEIVVLSPDQLTRLINEAVHKAVDDALQKMLEHIEKQTGRKEWLTNKEAMDYLGLSKSTLQRYRASGLIPYSKLGGTIYFKLGDLTSLLENHHVR